MALFGVPKIGGPNPEVKGIQKSIEQIEKDKRSFQV